MLRAIKRGKWYHVEEGKNSMGVIIPRHALGIAVRDKETKLAAENRVRELEKATEWPIKDKTEPKEPESLTLIEAYDHWLAGYKNRNHNTWKNYRSVKRILIEPLAAQGVTLVKEVTPKHLKDLQDSWLTQPNRRGGIGQTLNVIKAWRKFTSCFFNHCLYVREEIGRNPWKTVKSIKEIAPSKEQIMAGMRADKGFATLPLGEGDWPLIQEHVPAYIRNQMPGQTRFYRNPLFRHADTFLALLELMYETGLRRSDAIIFRPDWIKDFDGDTCTYTTAQWKGGNEVTCFLSQELVDRLRALPCLAWRGTADTPGAGLYPFYDGSSSHEDYMNDWLADPLRDLGRLLGIQKGKWDALRPHRFRDSFAVNTLVRGTSLEDLQRMLGHKNIKTTQDYYGRYVPDLIAAVGKRQAAARRAALYARAQETTRISPSVN